MKVMVTGCSGKIGIKVLKFLIKSKIFCYGNSRKKVRLNFTKKYFKHHRNNILDKTFFIPKDIRILCHLAFSTDYYKNKDTLKKNLEINKKIFYLVKKHNSLKKLIFISSASIYGPKNVGKVNEKVRYLNLNKYALSKYYSEKMFLKFKHVKVYNLRVPAVLCTGKENNFISNVIDRIKKNSKLRIYNPNNLFNNLILASDLCKFILKLTKGNFKSGTILLGSSKPLKNKIIVKKLIDYFNSKSIVFWRYKKKGFYLNISKAQRVYKFRPQKTISAINAYLKFKY